MIAFVLLSLPIFGVVALGWAATRTGLATPGALDALGAFSFRFALPALVLRLIAGQPLGRSFNPVFYGGYLASGGLIFALVFGLSRILDRQGVAIAEQTRVVAALYAGILRVHPFADGNHRTAFVALSAALWSLGLPAVEFADDKDMTDHDSTVAPALISPDGDIEPFARLLAARIEHARNPAT